MKKLLIALTAFSSLAIATPTNAPAQFNNAQIKCNGQVINSSDTLQQLSKQCKDFKAGKGHAALYDENSGKTVVCQTNGNNVETNTCQVKQ